jgi:hypothetical protein
LDPSEKFVREGIVELGPKEDYFTFVDGEYLGKLLRTHFGVDPEAGYTSLGRLRLTVERLEEPAAPGA